MQLILDNISRHIRLTRGEQEFFLSLLKRHTYRKGAFMLQAGEVCHTENFVLSGCMRTYHIDRSGDEHIVQFAPADWWTADLHSFLTQTPATYFIDALVDSEVLSIRKDDLEKLYVKVPAFERFFRIMFQNAFVAHQRRLTENLSLTADEKYLLFLKHYPGLEQLIPQKHIAAYLGITPEFLSKIRRRLMAG